MIHNIENNLAELKKEHKQLDLLIYINETGIEKCAESGSPRLKKENAKRSQAVTLETLVEKMSKEQLEELLKKVKSQLYRREQWKREQ